MSHKGDVLTECSYTPRTWFKTTGYVWRCSCGQFYVLRRKAIGIDTVVTYWEPVSLEDIA